MSESQNIEYKESWRDEYLKWVCGFANAQGGRIYIGVRDDGKSLVLPIARNSSRIFQTKSKTLWVSLSMSTC